MNPASSQPPAETERSFQLADKIYVIQSLGVEDTKTGTSLVEDVLMRANSRAGLGCALYEVEDRRGFNQVMSIIHAEAARTEGRRYPILHLEIHGLEDGSGLVLAPTEEVVSWVEFGDACRRINEACANNLLVTMAVCKGFHCLVESVSVTQPVPFYTLIGSEEVVREGEIESGFIRFYTKLVDGSALDDATQELGDAFSLFHAERLFVTTFIRYYREACAGRGKQERLEALVTRVVESRPGTQPDLKQLRRKARDMMAPKAETVRTHADRFLLAGVPENSGRFDVDALFAAIRSSLPA